MKKIFSIREIKKGDLLWFASKQSSTNVLSLVIRKTRTVLIEDTWVLDHYSKDEYAWKHKSKEKNGLDIVLTWFEDFHVFKLNKKEMEEQLARLSVQEL